MKPKYIALIFLIACSMCSCIKKNDPTPVKNDLTGVWLSDAHDLQFTIHDTQGRDSFVKYTDIKNDNGRYLSINSNGLVCTYEIKSITSHDMDITDSIKMPIHMTKIKEW